MFRRSEANGSRRADRVIPNADERVSFAFSGFHVSFHSHVTLSQTLTCISDFICDSHVHYSRRPSNGP